MQSLGTIGDLKFIPVFILFASVNDFCIQLQFQEVLEAIGFQEGVVLCFLFGLVCFFIKTSVVLETSGFVLD